MFPFLLNVEARCVCTMMVVPILAIGAGVRACCVDSIIHDRTETAICRYVGNMNISKQDYF
jgi:hypothetical protein